MSLRDKRLTILSEIEEFAFYGLPDFDDEQRLKYFTFTTEEIDLICRCREFHAQVYCAIQIGYFKAKNMFFKFSLTRIPKEDVHFILTRYFEDKELSEFNVTKHEYRFQQNEILNLFDYALWTKEILPLVHIPIQTGQRFQSKPSSDSNPNRAAIPIQTGQRFQSKPGSDSNPNRAVIPI